VKLSKRTLILVTSLVLAMSLSVFGTVAYLTSSQTVTNTFTVGDVQITLTETDVDEDGTPKFPVDTDNDGKADIEVSVEPDGTIRVDPTPDNDDDPQNDVVIKPGETGTVTDGDGNTVTVEGEEGGKVTVTENGKDPVTVDPATAEPSRDMGNEYNMVPGKSFKKDPVVTVVADSEDCYVRFRVTLNSYAALKAIFTDAQDADLLGKFVNVNTTDWTLKAAAADATADTVTYEFRYKEIVKGTNADVELPALFDTFTVPGELTGDQLKTLATLEMEVVADAIQTVAFETEDEAWTAFGNQYGN